jgi:hypothetical protein
MLGETAGGYGMVLPCEMELTWKVRRSYRSSDGAFMDIADPGLDPQWILIIFGS